MKEIKKYWLLLFFKILCLSSVVFFIFFSLVSYQKISIQYEDSSFFVGKKNSYFNFELDISDVYKYSDIEVKLSDNKYSANVSNAMSVSFLSKEAMTSKKCEIVSSKIHNIIKHELSNYFLEFSHEDYISEFYERKINHFYLLYNNNCLLIKDSNLNNMEINLTFKLYNNSLINFLSHQEVNEMN